MAARSPRTVSEPTRSPGMSRPVKESGPAPSQTPSRIVEGVQAVFALAGCLLIGTTRALIVLNADANGYNKTYNLGYFINTEEEFQYAALAAIIAFLFGILSILAGPVSPMSDILSGLFAVSAGTIAAYTSSVWYDNPFFEDSRDETLDPGYAMTGGTFTSWWEFFYMDKEGGGGPPAGRRELDGRRVKLTPGSDLRRAANLCRRNEDGNNRFSDECAKMAVAATLLILSAIASVYLVYRASQMVYGQWKSERDNTSPVLKAFARALRFFQVGGLIAGFVIMGLVEMLDNVGREDVAFDGTSNDHLGWLFPDYGRREDFEDRSDLMVWQEPEFQMMVGGGALAIFFSLVNFVLEVGTAIPSWEDALITMSPAIDQLASLFAVAAGTLAAYTVRVWFDDSQQPDIDGSSNPVLPTRLQSPVNSGAANLFLSKFAATGEPTRNGLSPQTIPVVPTRIRAPSTASATGVMSVQNVIDRTIGVKDRVAIWSDHRRVADLCDSDLDDNEDYCSFLSATAALYLLGAIWVLPMTMTRLRQRRSM